MRGGILWLIGLILIWMEFYLPGGVLGLLALVSLMGAVALWLPLGLKLWQWGAIGGSMILSIAAVSALALRTLRRGAAIETKSEGGYTAATFCAAAIGREGIALSDLSPAGFVLIDQERIAAISSMGHIAKGSKVFVHGGEGFSLLVSPHPAPSS